MAGHDEYGKRVLAQATRGKAVQYGASVEIDYGAGHPARIDGTVEETVAIEMESRVPKQVRGAVLDLICHPYPKKLLVLLPVHMSKPTVTAEQCRGILRRFCPEECFRVVVLNGHGEDGHLDEDAVLVATALNELGVNRLPEAVTSSRR